MDDDKTAQLIEQLRDIYCGRHSYSDEGDWFDNVDAALGELCDCVGLDFKSPQGL